MWLQDDASAGYVTVVLPKVAVSVSTCSTLHRIRSERGALLVSHELNVSTLASLPRLQAL